jgi:hypothetical protein
MITADVARYVRHKCKQKRNFPGFGVFIVQIGHAARGPDARVRTMDIAYRVL